MTSPATNRRRGLSLAGRESLTAILFVLPALALLFVFKLIPLASGFMTSLQRRGEFPTGTNYVRMLEDDIWIESIANALKGLLLLPVFILVPLVVAVALFNAVRGWRAYRAIYLLSYLMPAAIAGLIFSLLLGFDGPVNNALRAMGLDQLAIPWFSTVTTAMWAVYALVFWASFSLGTVIYLAALAAIPEEQFEAARLDGATATQALIHITIPWIRPTIGYWAVLMTAGIFLWLFPFITTATGGGPGYASTTPEVHIYQVFSAARNPEYAAALGISLFFIVMVLAILQVRWMYTRAGVE